MGEPEMAAAAPWAFGLDGRQTHKKARGRETPLPPRVFGGGHTYFLLRLPGPKKWGRKGNKKVAASFP